MTLHVTPFVALGALVVSVVACQGSASQVSPRQPVISVVVSGSDSASGSGSVASNRAPGKDSASRSTNPQPPSQPVDAVSNMIHKLMAKTPAGLRIAVLPPRANADRSEFAEKFCAYLQRRLMVEMANLNHVQVVERAELNQVYEELLRQHGDNFAPEMATTLGRYVGANAVLVSLLSRFNNHWQLASTLVAVEQAVVIAGVEEQLPITSAIPEFRPPQSTKLPYGGECLFVWVENKQLELRYIIEPHDVVELEQVLRQGFPSEVHLAQFMAMLDVDGNERISLREAMATPHILHEMK